MNRLAASITMLFLAIHLLNLLHHPEASTRQPLAHVSQKGVLDMDLRLQLCNNLHYIGNPFKYRSFRYPPLKPRHSTVILLMLLLCGDVETNPGPGDSTLYPYGICDRRVGWSNKAVCCDDCSLWYHKSCISMHSDDYDQLEATS